MGNNRQFDIGVFHYLDGLFFNVSANQFPGGGYNRDLSGNK